MEPLKLHRPASPGRRCSPRLADNATGQNQGDHPPLGGDRILWTHPPQPNGMGGPVGETPITPNVRNIDSRSPNNVLDNSISDNIQISENYGAAALDPADTTAPFMEDDPERTTEQQFDNLTFGDNNWQYREQE